MSGRVAESRGVENTSLPRAGFRAASGVRSILCLAIAQCLISREEMDNICRFDRLTCASLIHAGRPVEASYLPADAVNTVSEGVHIVIRGITVSPE